MNDAVFALTLGRIALIVTILLSGCAPTGGSVHGIHERSGSFTHTTESPVPGLDHASISVIVLKAGPPAGVPFVVWSDLPNGNGGSGGANARGASYDGNHRASDGRRIDFHAASTDGVTGTIVIDETTYDFAQGALFLISTQNGSTSVKQVEFDVTGFPIDREELMTIADANSAIRDFFRDAIETKPDDVESPEAEELLELKVEEQ